MTGVPLLESAPVHCAAWTRDHSVDPIGTAGFGEALLLVELPLPWPARVEEAPALRPLAGDLEGARVLIQAVVPDDPDPAGARVVAYRAHAGAGYVRRAAAVPPAEIPAAARRLLAEGPGEPAGMKEVLVCGHGRRDRCCGSLGTQLALRLQAGAGDRDGHGVRVHRTSHTGGHRFAPTGIVLPEGTVWGYLDDDVLAAVLSRSGDVARVLPHYRGYLRLASPALQALEREVLGTVGWRLLGARRWGEQVGDATYHLHASWGDGPAMTWSARVRPVRTVPVPVCGAPVADARKSQTELAVEDLAPVG